MQAMQSGTASGPGIYSEKFAALRHVTRQMSLNVGAVSGDQRMVERCSGGFAADPVVGVAEGAGLAHDAGNLLGALSVYSDLLAMPGVLHEEHLEYAAELRMLSDRSWAMIDRLVNHAGAGRRSKVAGESSVLPDVVDRCKGLLSKVAGRMVEVSYGVGAFQPVRVPVESVERILTNLVKNAAEATPWVGAISIDVEGVTERVFDGDGAPGEPRRRVVMTVRDRGRGMDAAMVGRLMQNGGVSTTGGQGLGFRVVRELVAISGGCLQVESQPEMGTSISMEWFAMRSAEVKVMREEAVMKEEEWIAC